MAIVKIKELDSISEINNTDYMVIEDSQDTKKITIGQLKSVFSVDNKLTALKNDFDNKIQSLSNECNNRYDEIINSNLDWSNIQNNLLNENTKIKRRLDIAESDLIVLKQGLSDTNSQINSIKSDINTINNDIENVNQHITNQDTILDSIKDELYNTNNRISILESNYQDLYNELSNVKSTISTIIETQNRDRDNTLALVKKLENRTLNYLDYYHHIHDNPPQIDLGPEVSYE